MMLDEVHEDVKRFRLQLQPLPSATELVEMGVELVIIEGMNHRFPLSLRVAHRLDRSQGFHALLASTLRSPCVCVGKQHTS